MSISKKNAKSLAVSYQAYIQAVDASDWNGISVWGGILARMQEATGIELQRPDNIACFVRRADTMLELEREREERALDAQASITLLALARQEQDATA